MRERERIKYSSICLKCVYVKTGDQNHTSLSLEEKPSVLLITCFSNLYRDIQGADFSGFLYSVPFASALPCPQPLNFCVPWSSVLSPLLSHITAPPRESHRLQWLQLSISPSAAGDSYSHPFHSTPTLTFRLIFLTICCILSLEFDKYLILNMLVQTGHSQMRDM